MKQTEALQRKWAHLLVTLGLLLFAVACVHGDSPEWTIYVGPALMLAGIIIMICQPQ